MLTWSLIPWTNKGNIRRSIYWKSFLPAQTRWGRKLWNQWKPEYPWTIIIIGGETERQMVPTMQITVVACVRPCSVRLRTLSCEGMSTYWGAAISGFEQLLGRGWEACGGDVCRVTLQAEHAIQRKHCSICVITFDHPSSTSIQPKKNMQCRWRETSITLLLHNWSNCHFC